MVKVKVKGHPNSTRVTSVPELRLLGTWVLALLGHGVRKTSPNTEQAGRLISTQD